MQGGEVGDLHGREVGLLGHGGLLGVLWQIVGRLLAGHVGGDVEGGAEVDLVDQRVVVGDQTVLALRAAGL